MMRIVPGLIGFLLLSDVATAQQKSYSPLSESTRFELNNFSHEMQACHVYNIFAGRCFDEKDKTLTAKMQATANAFNELALNSGQLAGLSTKAMLARTEILSKEMLEDVDGDCVNISVLLNKYAKSCKALMEGSSDRIKRIFEKPAR